MTNPDPNRPIDRLIASLPPDKIIAPDTPENRMAFIMLCIEHDIPITERDVDIWFAPTEAHRKFLREIRYLEERYGGFQCRGCGYDYSLAETGQITDSFMQHTEGFMKGAYGVAVRKTCPDCHPQFIKDRMEAEEALAKEEAWDEMERQEVEWD
jgi:hypothetical protein